MMGQAYVKQMEMQLIIVLDDQVILHLLQTLVLEKKLKRRM